MEQLEVPMEAKIATLSLRRSLSAEVRASLEAVEEAQSAAKVRARQETARTRIGFALAIGALALGTVVVVPRIARGRHVPVQTAAATAAAPAEPMAAPSAVAPVAPVAPEALDKPAPAPVVAAAPGTTSNGASATEGCDTALIQKSPWRLSPQACVRAFASDPTNADLALAIAHAEHAHGSPTASAEWAQRALSLDANSAEAYVLIARAAIKGRHPEEARAAYRHYLELAPRGWHQREARAALR